MKNKFILLSMIFILLLVGCKMQNKKEAQVIKKQSETQLSSITTPEKDIPLSVKHNKQENNNLKQETLSELAKNEIKINNATIYLISDNKKYTNEEYYFLNNNPKTFEINFDEAVNKKQVQDYLEKCLEKQGLIDFKWLDSKKLVIYLSNLVNQKYYFDFGISNITPVINGNFAFCIDNQDEFYVYNTTNKTTEKVLVPHHQDLIFPMTKLINNNIFVLKTSFVVGNQFSYTDNYYNVKTKGFFTLVDNIQQESYTKIFDAETIFHRDDNIYGHSIGKIYAQEDNVLKLLYSNDNLVDYKKYKNKSIAMMNKDNYINLLIYDNMSKSTIEYQLNILYLLLEEGVVYSDYVLSDVSNKIIIEGLDISRDPFYSIESSKNLYILDLQTQKLDILLENYHDPIKFNDHLILVKDNQEKNYFFNTETLTLNSLPTKFQNAQQIFVLDNDNIICNNNGTVWSYNLTTSELVKIKENIKTIFNIFDDEIFYAE